jgi:hypothetical protein
MKSPSFDLASRQACGLYYSTVFNEGRFKSVMYIAASRPHAKNRLKATEQVGTVSYLTFLLHISQYLSITVTPSPTLNKASTVAKLLQLMLF